MTERVFKILVIGDSTVGKTSFVQRYVNNSFTKDYKCTIGGTLQFCAAAVTVLPVAS